MTVLRHSFVRQFGPILGALLSLAGCAATAPESRVVESRAIAADRDLANFSVTVHVLLQVHEHPDEQRRASQDVQQVAACQESVVATALRLAEQGAGAIVVEGLYAAGTPDQPEPLRPAQTPPTIIPSAKWILASRAELAVYGFEARPFNEFGVAVVRELGASTGRARELAKDGYDGLSEADKAEYGRLVQDEVTRLNLWHAGVMPARGFLALQTALAVALARRENQVQLLIGKQHWSDLLYAVNRHEDVRLRLVPYPCE